MSRPSWWPKNPFSGPGRNRDLWDQSAQAMARAMLEEFESIMLREFEGSGSFHYVIGRMVWEQLKSEVEHEG